ncbi:MAG: hypothetical protein OXG51_07420 [Gammaproteobacteria bacterium]|nr:hypothetical protein [Gammaproteobacteria bacterium]
MEPLGGPSVGWFDGAAGRDKGDVDSGVVVAVGHACRIVWPTLPMSSREIAIGAIDAIEIQTRWRWGGIRIRTPSGNSAVPGLARRDATARLESLSRPEG